MIEELIAVLRSSEKLSDLTAEQFTDIFWLAIQQSRFSALNNPEITIDPPNNVTIPSVENKLEIADTQRQTQSSSRSQESLTPSKDSQRQIEQRQTDIYANTASIDNQESKRADTLPIRVPDAAALQNKLELVRSLKPLMRRVHDPYDAVLDEVATTERITTEQLWIPVLKPALEPWLELDLVVDEGASMLIWRNTILELRQLLQTLSAFRNIRTWSLLTNNETQVQIRPGIGSAARQQYARSPRELVDPNGRRLILVLSDCMSPCWRNGVKNGVQNENIISVLNTWANNGPVAIVQMLPKWLWARTALGSVSTVQLSGLTPGVANQQLQVRQLSLWNEIGKDQNIKVPILTLEPEMTATWSQMVAGMGTVWTSGVVFKSNRQNSNHEDELDESSSELTAKQRFQRFRLTASPMARRLAGLVAVAPIVTLPVIRLIQQTMLSQSSQVHVAEVLLGGLVKLKADTKIALEMNPNEVEYEFIDKVNEILLDSLPTTDKAIVKSNLLEKLTKHIADKIGLSTDTFAGFLQDPRQIGSITQQPNPIASLAIQKLKNLGGRYADFGEQLEIANKELTALANFGFRDHKELEPLTHIWKAPITSIKVQEQVRQLFQQGFNFLQNKQLDPARENLNRALDIAQNINTEDGKRLQVDILNTLGQSHNPPYDWGLAQAIETCEQSLGIARNIGYRHGEAIALTVIGNAYYWYPGVQRDFPKVIECYKAAKSIFQETQNLEGLIDALYHLQDAYGYTSKYAQAIETNNERLNIAQQLILGGEKLLLTEKKQTGEQWVLIGREQEASALFCLASNYQSLSEYLDAQKYYEQCLTKAREMNGNQAQWLQIRSLAGVGNIDRINGNLDDAINRYEKSLKIAENIDEEGGQANALQALAEIYYYQGKLDEAWTYNERSLEIKRIIQDQIGEGNSIAFQGSISLARGNYDEALNYFNQSLPIMEQVKNFSGIANILTDIGLTHYYLNRIPEAEQCLSQAIELWEYIRESLGNRDNFKVSIFEQQARTYQLQQAILIAQQKITEALEVAERGRARAFVELLASRLSPSRTDELTTPPPTIKQIQQIAQEQNSTLVEYSIIGSELLFIWVIKPTGEVDFCPVDLKPLWQTNNTLENLVRLMRDSLGVRGREWKPVVPKETDPGGGDFSQRLKKLHQILIQPIAYLLPTQANAKVIFIPQGSLFLIPFPALQDDSDQYLIEKHTILTTPSIQVLQLTRQQQAKVTQAALQEVLVLGNPTMPIILNPNGTSSQLRDLPGAEKEAKAIASLFQTQAIIGNGGTKEVIVNRMLQARIIHLATRGLGSAIALAPSGNDNGLLTAQEILDLNLNAELVVLSAGDTGRGRLTGDGVIELSRSFISAGVSSVIVSLWAIPDSPTAELMIEFYEKLKQNADKAQALRQAMLITIQKHPHPKNWAAFTLIGEW